MEPRRSSTERRLRRLSGRRGVQLPFDLSRLRARARVRLPSTGRGRVAAAVTLLIVVLGLWAAWDLRSARQELLAARNELASAAGSIGNGADANAAADLRAGTRRAVARTSSAVGRVRRSPILRLAGALPGLSTQRSGVLHAVETAHDAARIGDELAAVAEQQSNGITVTAGAVDVRAVRVLAEAVDRAGAALRDLPTTHSDAQWGPLGNATTDLDGLLDDTASRLINGAGVMRVAADLLGADRPQRILIALMNNAEMRDQGMVLSFAVAETTNGTFHMSRFGSVTEIPVDEPITDVQLPEGTRRIFGALAPDRLWQSVNATADTSLSGAVARSLYRAATGDTVDAVVALDVPALSRLLSVTGEVTVPGIDQPISAENADEVLLDELYRLDPSETNDEVREQRQARLAATAAAIVERIRTSSVNAAGIIRALGNAAAGRHAWVSTADPAGQLVLERAGLSGGPGRVHPERTIYVSVQNGTATKLDYFVDPEVDVEVAITDDGTALIHTEVTLPNKAPVPTPASEQFGPDGFVTTVAGHYRGRVYFWGPAGSDQLDSVEESGLRLNFDVADVPAGASRTVAFDTVVPGAVKDGKLRLRFVPQPRVRPMALRVRVVGVGWKVDDPARTVDWGATADLTWELRRR